MLPSVVASEVATALSEFVRTQFLPSNPRMTKVVEDFLRTPENLLKGPYMSVALPFQTAPDGGEAFPEVPLGFVPWRHQRSAFDRLGQRKSTVVATGTGSGKTECFLLPILNDCRIHAGQPGIKAIVIYPMNALAIDQAGRIAKLIHTTPSLRARITAGIYVGRGRKSGTDRMTKSSILSDRAVIVDHPPDILLTNYKMLDYLLSRPRDQRLWKHNTASTLRWLVVDELHTFDGAQGTDLACLIRRLKARLGAGGSDLTCIGTSATLGDSGKDDLVAYVRDIFGEPFEADSIIGESRQTVEEFLAKSPVRHHLPPFVDLSQSVDHSQFQSRDAYLRHQSDLFFGGISRDEFHAPGWRSDLGNRLRHHVAFHRLLEVLDHGPRAILDIAGKLRASLPFRGHDEAIALVRGLFALISHARSKDGKRPLLDVSAHLWVREMGRMVCSVSEDAPVEEPDHVKQEDSDHHEAAELAASGRGRAPVRSSLPRRRRLRHSDDLDPSKGPIHLPLIQCRICRATGWGAVLGSGHTHLGRDLRHFYNQFFDRDLDVRFLFPVRPPPGAQDRAASVCGSCGYMGPGSTPCDSCGPDHMVKVFVPDQTVLRDSGNGKRSEFSRDCPFCTAPDSLSIMGARSSVLVSAALGQIYGSRYNDDAKVIAFSDNVQDAAHRAAFVAHRTWRVSKRVVVAQAIPKSATLKLSEFARSVAAHAEQLPGGADTRSREDFVERFIAPDRSWLRAFKQFQERGRLPPKGSLPQLVRDRLEWEAFTEAGFGASRPHSIQRARVAAVGPDLATLRAAAAEAVQPLREEIGGLEDLSARRVTWVVLGILRRMLQRGAILSEEVAAVRKFLASGCSSWSLHRNLALPDYGNFAPLVYPRDAGQPPPRNGTESLARLHPKSWYQLWVRKVVRAGRAVLPDGYEGHVLEILMTVLGDHGLVTLRRSGKSQVVWAINPDRFLIGRDVRVLRCASPTRELVVPDAEARLWVEAPCIDLKVDDTYKTCHRPKRQTWAGRMYRSGDVHRIWPEEHTALVSNRKRDRLQQRFSAETRKPLDPNLMSATPTLEMGIDIGDLSTVVLCSVPPSQANYLQRIGRAGRRDGNALTMTVAAARAHDLSFYVNPLEMLHGSVSTPGVFLNASAVLERQLTSFCLDDWAASCGDPGAVPDQIRRVLQAVDSRDETAFPYTFFSHISRYRAGIFQRFLEVFGASLKDDTREYLRTFLWGESGKEPQLEVKILDCLEHALSEQRAFRNDLRRLRDRLSGLKKAPDSEATELDRREVAQARDGLGKLSRSLKRRDTFGFFTDRGLIPNYAFPEEGVGLRSVIVRQEPSGGQTGAGQAMPPEPSASEAYQYMRPASAALSELAPENRFFAEGHRVKIDRIDVRVSKPERWRLCPSCTHLERVDDIDAFRTCPHCGDPMWADGGQVRMMIPLRLVHATTGIRRAQIMDDLEVRDPLFYQRHLVAEHQLDAIRRAFGTQQGEEPFGFEYVSRTTFREMNFGPVSKKGHPTKFDGESVPRVGFRICRKCGQVQSRRSGAQPEHDWTCGKRVLNTYAELPDTSSFADSVAPVARDPDIIDCLFLYREFASESLTILMPGVDDDRNSPQVQSFIAAVELGLKRKFRGKVDHIHAMVQGRSVPDGSTRPTVLILYDSVPGGTGYLKELTSDPARLMEVFQTAWDCLAACDCEDGCHKCLRAYRRGRDLPRPSKKEANLALRKILDCSDGLEPIKTVTTITPGPVESDLEARFLKALRAREKSGMAMRNAIVRGHSGWTLTINKRTWTIEAQVNLGAGEGVLVPSKPDFVIYPPAGLDGALPVAVFLDGFAYHWNRTGDDSAKRMALIRAGFLQWSLTWHDLDSAFGHPSEILDILRGSIPETRSGSAMASPQRLLDRRWGTGPLRSDLPRLQSSFDLLLRYLQEPDLERWRKAVFTDALCLFDQSRMTSPTFRQTFDTAARELVPDGAQETLGSAAQPLLYAGGGHEFGSGFKGATLFVTLPPSAIQSFDPTGMAFALHLDDRQTDADDYRDLWNGTLRLFNLIQFLSGSWWTTSTAVAKDAYPDFRPADTPEEGLSDDWRAAISEADDCAHNLLRGLAALGVRPPDAVGYEMANSAGIVVAEAELAWEDRRVAVLREDQLGDTGVFEGKAWQVFDHRATPSVVSAAVVAAAD